MGLTRIILKIEILEGEGDCITKITNDSDHDLFICVKPTPPARKIKDSRLVKANEFVLFDGFKLDMEKVYFKYESTKNKLSEKNPCL